MQAWLSHASRSLSLYDVCPIVIMAELTFDRSLGTQKETVTPSWQK